MIPEQVHVMRIDAQGSEPWILRGMSQLLARSPGIQILMEFLPRLYSPWGCRSLRSFFASSEPWDFAGGVLTDKARLRRISAKMPGWLRTEFIP